jgi:hypothetical protein
MSGQMPVCHAATDHQPRADDTGIAKPPKSPANVPDGQIQVLLTTNRCTLETGPALISHVGESRMMYERSSCSAMTQPYIKETVLIQYGCLIGPD